MHKQSPEMGLTSFGLVFEYSDLQICFLQFGRTASFRHSLKERSDQIQVFDRKGVHSQERITSHSLYPDWLKDYPCNLKGL